MGVIYKITNPKGRLYVGKTKCLRKRINSHVWNAKKEGNIILAKSIKKYGWGNHKIEIIEEVDDSLLNEREVFWIKELKTYCYDYPGQMNMTKGADGNNGSWSHDLVRIKHYSEMMSGTNNHFFGKIHSDETKKIIGEKASIRNKKNGITIPKWGAEKGRLKCIEAVIMYDKNGEFIKEFDSVGNACKFIKISHSSISDSCRGITSNSGGFVFRYKTENYPLKIVVGKIKEQTMARPVICFLGSYVIEYPKAEIASQELGIPKTTIIRASYYNNLKPIRTGHIFIYKDLYEKIKKVS